jgi:hypothetical protein
MREAAFAMSKGHILSSKSMDNYESRFVLSVRGTMPWRSMETWRRCARLQNQIDPDGFGNAEMDGWNAAQN